MVRGITITIAVLVWLVLPDASLSQVAGSALGGRVRSAESENPVRGAIVWLNNVAGTPTDSSGRFHFSYVERGTSLLVVRRIGFAPLEVMVWVGGGDTLIQLDIALEPVAFQLADMDVTAPRAGAPHLLREGFYDRQRMGFGHFVTREDIERMDPLFTSDIVERLPGVVNGESTRGIDRLSRRLCLILDGIWVDSEQDVRETLDFLLPPGTVEAVEVYTGLSQVPMRFSYLGCRGGVVVVWTR